MAQETQVNNLVINKMTKQQYESITPNSNELYFIVDDLGVDAKDLLGSAAVGDTDTPVYWNGTSLQPITAYDGNAATATSASKLQNTSKIGDTNKPVYFKNDGTPAAISYEINKTVPSNAVFTDTTYTFASGDNNGQIKVTPSGGTAQNINVTGLEDTAFLDSDNFFSLNVKDLGTDITPTTASVNVDNIITMGNYYFIATTVGSGLAAKKILSLPNINAFGNLGSGILKVFEADDKIYQLCCMKPSLISIDLELAIRYRYYDEIDEIFYWSSWQSLIKDTDNTNGIFHNPSDFYTEGANPFLAGYWDRGELQQLLIDNLTTFDYSDTNGDETLDPILLGTFLNKIYQCLIEYKTIMDDRIFNSSSEGALYKDEEELVPCYGILPIHYGGTGNENGYIQTGTVSSCGLYATAEGGSTESLENWLEDSAWEGVDGISKIADKTYTFQSFDGADLDIAAGYYLFNINDNVKETARVENCTFENGIWTVVLNKNLSSFLSNSCYLSDVNWPYTTASGICSHAEGSATTASGSDAHAEGCLTTASGICSHAEGWHTTASGNSSHTEGWDTIASGICSHAEGIETTASERGSHAEGNGTMASGFYAHAEGNSTIASGSYSHAEGSSTTASNSYAHAEGLGTIASANISHAEGYYTTAQRIRQHVFGQYNILDNSQGTLNGSTWSFTNSSGSTGNYGRYIEIVGNGTSSSARSNARTLDWNGNETLKGKLTVGTDPTNSMDVATKSYVDRQINNKDYNIDLTYDYLDWKEENYPNTEIDDLNLIPAFLIYYIDDGGWTFDDLKRHQFVRWIYTNPQDESDWKYSIKFYGGWEGASSITTYVEITAYSDDGFYDKYFICIPSNYDPTDDSIRYLCDYTTLNAGIFRGLALDARSAECTTTQNAIAKYSDAVGTFANSGVIIDNQNDIHTSGSFWGNTVHLNSNIYLSSYINNNIPCLDIAGENGDELVRISNIEDPISAQQAATKNYVDNAISTAVPSGSLLTDENVKQTAVTASSYTYWRPLIFGSSNSQTEGFSPSTVTDQVYATSVFSVQPSTGTIKATTFKGNASTASKITNLTSTDNASSSTTWRKVWMCYTDNVTGRPAVSDAFVFQTSTGILKATKFQGDGSLLTELNGSNISTGTVPFARLPSMYWANTAITSAASYNTTPEVASVKIGNGTTAAAGAKSVTLQYDAALEVLNFVFI